MIPLLGLEVEREQAHQIQILPVGVLQALKQEMVRRILVLQTLAIQTLVPRIQQRIRDRLAVRAATEILTRIQSITHLHRHLHRLRRMFLLRLSLLRLLPALNFLQVHHLPPLLLQRRQVLWLLPHNLLLFLHLLIHTRLKSIQAQIRVVE